MIVGDVMELSLLQIGSFFLLFPVLAAAFPSLDLVLNNQLPLSEAARTKEFRVIWLVYVAVAGVVAAIFYASDKLDIGILGFIAMVLGFPMILQSKLLTVRRPNSPEGTDLGFEFVHKYVSAWLLPGMQKSILEQSVNLLAVWLTRDSAKLDAAMRNYIFGSLPPDEAATVKQWMTNLMMDLAANPSHRDDNLRALFSKAMEIGKHRGVRFILGQCR